jgi:acyl carrier protein
MKSVLKGFIVSDNTQKLLNLISKILDIVPGSISDATSPENTETWDSFKALVLVAELENEFNISIEMSEFYAVKCVKDIKVLLRRHGVSLSE